MNLVPLTDTDRKVLKAAQEIIAKRFDSINFRHTVGAAVSTGQGQILAAVNLYANCGFGPCAEAVLLGKAASDGIAGFEVLAAVGGPDRNFKPMPPCGNCRQILIEYAPHVEIILEFNNELGKIPIKELIPFNYVMI